VALAMVGARTDVNAVVIASGENFPDGLAASALAGAVDAAQGGSPMLLTTAGSLPTTVIATINTIKAANAGLNAAVIVGGTGVVSANVEAQLTALGLTVTRLAGADRYETANLVAAAVKANNAGTVIGSFGGYRTAFLANGNNFPDALAASSWAFKNKHPLFLTDGSSLTAGTKAAMTAAGVQQVIILGGLSAVSAEAATEAAGVTGVITTVRISGDTRYDTATALATTLATVDAAYKTKAMLVSGTNFPDALSAAQLAGGSDSYAIIPVTDPLPAAVSTWMTANQATLTNVRAIGGTSAVPASVVTEAKAAATIAKLTATIEALDGAGTAKVTFSGAVTAATAQLATNYTVVSALGVVKTVTAGAGSYTAPTTTALGYTTLTVSGGLAAGDVVSVIAGNTIVSSTNVGVAPVSATVAADTSAPTATIHAIASTVAAGADKVWVTFSANTKVSTIDTAAASADFVVTKGSGAIGAPVAVIGNCAAFSGLTYACDVTTADLVVGDTVTLKANALDSTASVAVKNAAVSSVAVTDIVKPTLQSVTYSSGATGGSAASIKVVQAKTGVAAAAGEVTLTARAGSAAFGRAGNSYKLAVANGAGAVACTYSSATKTVTVSITAATDTATDVANACNSNADVSALFVATATGAALTGADTVASADFAGGKDLVTMTLTFSEPIKAGDESDVTAVKWDGSTADAAALGTAAVGGVGTAAAQGIAGKLVVTMQSATLPIAGVSTITVNSDYLDRAGLALDTSATSHIVALYPAS
jgi:putative cell wall-binding protein